MISAFASLSLSPFSENSEERKVFVQSVGLTTKEELCLREKCDKIHAELSAIGCCSGNLTSLHSSS